jgi:hypothetical protein
VVQYVLNVILYLLIEWHGLFVHSDIDCKKARINKASAIAKVDLLRRRQQDWTGRWNC